MTGSQTAILTAAGLLVASTLIKAQAAGNLNFYPQGVSDVGLQSGTPVVVVRIRVQNVGGTNLILRSIAGNVYCNSVLIGNAEQFNAIQFAPNSVSYLTINLRLSWIGIVQDILNAWNNQSLAQTVEWDMRFAVDGLPVQAQKLTFKIGT
jgi:LEA14-like dessication related protein